jgi:hypothetical protein
MRVLEGSLRRLWVLEGDVQRLERELAKPPPQLTRRGPASSGSRLPGAFTCTSLHIRTIFITETTVVPRVPDIDPLVEHDLIDKMKAELPFYLSATYPRCCPRRVEVHLAPGVLAEVLGMSPTCARTKRASLHAPAPGVGGIPLPPSPPSRRCMLDSAVLSLAYSSHPRFRLNTGREASEINRQREISACAKR